MTSRYDIALIGGGIVGLATARALLEAVPGLRLLILEKEARLGAHQTGHNSGVIHSGIYYRPGSYKARLCVAGARLMRELCAAEGIPVLRCGKVIVATSEAELPRLSALYERGVQNGVPGLSLIGPEALREIEPHASALRAIHSPETASVDFVAVLHALARRLQAAGAELRLGAKVTAIASLPEGYEIATPERDHLARHIINCAGLHSDRIAWLCGAAPDLQIIPFRGEYYLLKPERRDLVRGLIYPVPDPEFPFLGVHLTRTVHGEVEAGPNAVLAFAREGYRFADLHPGELLGTLAYPGFWAMARKYWRTGLYEMRRSFSQALFVRDLRRLVPELTAADVVRDGAGVRAQAVARDGSLVDDFRILTQAGGRAIHVLNAPSPAATASLAIGRHIASLALCTFSLGRAASTGPVQEL
jgi:L-2-hydroxyglutarate oxidase LhgO